MLTNHLCYSNQAPVGSIEDAAALGRAAGEALRREAGPEFARIWS